MVPARASAIAWRWARARSRSVCDAEAADANGDGRAAAAVAADISREAEWKGDVAKFEADIMGNAVSETRDAAAPMGTEGSSWRVLDFDLDLGGAATS